MPLTRRGFQTRPTTKCLRLDNCLNPWYPPTHRFHRQTNWDARAISAKIAAGSRSTLLPPPQENKTIYSTKNPLQSTLIRSSDYNYTSAFSDLKFCLVNKIMVKADKCSSQFPSQPAVLLVSRSPEIIIFNHEQHIPRQPSSHALNDAIR
jgi:hypothetical protein